MENTRKIIERFEKPTWAYSNYYSPLLSASKNQEAKDDSNKLDLTLVPTQAIKDIAEVREYGTKKYGDRDNWEKVEVERYDAAAFRHLLAYIDDPTGKDEESGIEHYKHLICNIAFICALRHQEKNNKKE